MPSWINWEIHDNEGTNPLALPGSFEFCVEYDFDPGNSGFITAGAVSLTKSVCKNIRFGPFSRVPTKEEMIALSGWFWDVLDKQPDIRYQIESNGAEQMSFGFVDVFE